ncbi:MAG TPA: hopanoid biosynthesis-associated protein HpnK [Nitrospira sp.]|nr:hopanoid biosynthesis-associated protein HpnK [Nitrospira sp.]
MRRLIVTGDDFGLAIPVNEAIEEAHRNGILTTASLMVGATYAADAIERAKRLPTLKVGLHLVLVEGRPVLSPVVIPDLVDQRGLFSTRLLKAGLQFFFRSSIPRQLEVETRAQFESFKRTGLVLDHVNAHNHMHLHPTVLGIILKVGQDFGLRSVRLPYEPLIPSLRACRDRRAGRFLSWALLWPWMQLLKSRLKLAGMECNDFVFGFHDSGHLTSDLLERFIQYIPAGVTEIYCHPATRRCPEIDETMADYEHEEELKALIDPDIRAALMQQSVQRLTFSQLLPRLRTHSLR